MLYEDTYIGTVATMWMDSARGKFVNSLAEMLLYTQKNLCKNSREHIKYFNAPCSYHSLARNKIAENTEGDWVFMTDTDHMFAPDLVTRLVDLSKKYNAKVISGIYQFKLPPHGPVASVWTPNDKACQLQDWNREKDLISVGPVGGGCLLVYKEVFDRIREELKESPFSEYLGLSEDYSFCHRCKRLGIPVYLAPKIESHHLIDVPLSIEDFVPPPRDGLSSVQGGI